jgi:DNA-binding NtrC family response regulator
MKPLRLLVALPDAAKRQDLVRLLQAEDVLLVESVDAAAEALTSDIDAVLLDLSLPGIDIMTLRRALGSPLQEPESLEAAERRHLALVLHHTAGNKRKAAHILGISRSTLLNKVRKYQLEDDR